MKLHCLLRFIFTHLQRLHERGERAKERERRRQLEEKENRREHFYFQDLELSDSEYGQGAK